MTFDHEHVPTDHLHALAADGIAVRPGPDALVHAQDKGSDASPSRRARRPVPAQRGGHLGLGRRGVRPAVRSEDHPRWVRRQGRVDRPLGPGLRRSPSTRPPPPVSRCWPRSSSTSAASCPPWWPARPAARRPPTPSSPPPSSTASATRSSPPRRTSRPRWPVRRRRSPCASPVRSTSPGILAVELFETDRRPDPGQRAGDAPPQHRPLDPGRCRDVPVRESPARRAWTSRWVRPPRAAAGR